MIKRKRERKTTAFFTTYTKFQVLVAINLFLFFIISVLLASNSMSLVLYVIVFKYSIFELHLLDLELYL